MSRMSIRHHPLATLSAAIGLLILGLLVLSPGRADAQVAYFFPEGEAFDPAIPSPEEFLGYSIGSFHTRHDRIVSYMQELARLSDRATYQSIGMTYEHRPMPVLTVTSPENHTRLEAIRQEHLASMDPNAPPSANATRPAIVHLGYGVHGNETSSAEAAMLTAYWLVAGTGTHVERYRKEGVFHIEPVLNPDGRDRHTHWANMNRAQPFVADNLDREHNEVWPGGRTNHYWFDLNRDWLPLVNPESKARIQSLIQEGESEGAKLLVDGRDATVDGHENGNFLRPTILDGVAPGSKLSTTEIFGPVLSLTHAGTVDEAIEMIARNPYGNASSIFTASGAAARKFRYEAPTGNVGINIGVAAPMAYFPFSGWKDSFLGILHAQGHDAVEFYTEKKVVIERWPKEWSRKF